MNSDPSADLKVDLAELQSATRLLRMSNPGDFLWQTTLSRLPGKNLALV
jgi:hypothetical protein